MFNQVFSLQHSVAFQRHRDFIMGETLCLEMELADELSGSTYPTMREVDLDSTQVVIGLARVASTGAV